MGPLVAEVQRSESEFYLRRACLIEAAADHFEGVYVMGKLMDQRQ